MQLSSLMSRLKAPARTPAAQRVLQVAERADKIRRGALIGLVLLALALGEVHTALAIPLVSALTKTARSVGFTVPRWSTVGNV